MRTTRTFLTIALAALFAAPGLAQREAPVRRGEIIQRIDQNQDGRLDESEREAARNEFRQRAESRRGESDAGTPRSGRGPLERGRERFTRRDGTGRGMRGRDAQGRDEGTDRRTRGAAPSVRGPLGRSLERRFGNGDGRVGPMERMRLRRFAERLQGARSGGSEAQGARPEGRRGRGTGEGRRGARFEPPRNRRPNSGGEDF